MEEQTQTSQQNAAPVGKMRLRLLQSLVVLNVVLVLLVLGVVMNLIPKPTLQASPTEEGSLSQRVSAPQEVSSTPSSQGQDPTVDRSRLWPAAEQAYAAGDYNTARERFGRLMQEAERSNDEVVKDYFSLRMAQCAFRLGHADGARTVFEDLLRTVSPIIRGVSCYELARMDFTRGRYLSARMRAYQSLGALGALEREIPLESDVQYLIGQSLTEKVRAYTTSERFLKWSSQDPQDPFAGLSREKLRILLNQGKGLLSASALGPELKVEKRPGQLGRWDATSSGLAVEDFINQFGRRLDKQIQWIGMTDGARRRPVVLHFRSRSSQLIAETGAGSAGLISRYAMDTLNIHDPQGSGMVREHQQIVTEEAVSFWRRFFLRHPTDSRIPEGHFALAAISEWNDRKIEAVQEYSILASRYERSPIAPEALLRSAKLKLEMMNYTGARKDLQDMLDLYPNHSGADEVYVLLGRVQETSGNYGEAAEIYRQLYYRDLSRRSRREAAYGAGRCHFRLKQYDKATTWLGRFVVGFEEPNGDDFAKAYFMIGRSQMSVGGLDTAAQALQRGLLGGPPADIRIPAMLDLVRVQIRQEEFISALGVLDSLSREDLSSDQVVDLAVLRSRVFQAVGLLDRARSALRMELSQNENHVRRRAKLTVALAECHLSAGDVDAARKLLAEIVPTLDEPQLLAEASTLLGEVCLKAEKYGQAKTIVAPVLQMECDRQTRQRAQRVLGEVYLADKEYEKAALMFSGLRNAPAASEPNDENETTAESTGEGEV